MSHLVCGVAEDKRKLQDDKKEQIMKSCLNIIEMNIVDKMFPQIYLPKYVST